MQDYRKLIVWQKSHHLVLGTYAVSAQLMSPAAAAARPAAEGGNIGPGEHRGRLRPGDGSGLSAVSAALYGFIE
jgi:hypothetical protein